MRPRRLGQHLVLFIDRHGNLLIKYFYGRRLYPWPRHLQSRTGRFSSSSTTHSSSIWIHHPSSSPPRHFPFRLVRTYLNRLAAADNNSSTGPSATKGATINATSGVIAAGVATAVTNPFDAVKTRLQLRPDHYRNMFRAARLMLRDEGIKSMFRGLSLRVGRKAISSALTWTVYEEAIRRVEKALV